MLCQDRPAVRCVTVTTCVGHRSGCCMKVNARQAQLVAEAFAAARSVPSDPMVRAAYAELSDQAARWFARLTTADARRPVRVVFTRCREPYSDARELSESV